MWTIGIEQHIPGDAAEQIRRAIEAQYGKDTVVAIEPDEPELGVWFLGLREDADRVVYHADYVQIDTDECTIRIEKP